MITQGIVREVRAMTAEAHRAAAEASFHAAQRMLPSAQRSDVLAQGERHRQLWIGLRQTSAAEARLEAGRQA